MKKFSMKEAVDVLVEFVPEEAKLLCDKLELNTGDLELSDNRGEIATQFIDAVRGATVRM